MNAQQKRVLDFIRDYYARTGRGPTQREVRDGLGIKSLGGVNYQIRTLADYGFLKKVKEFAGSYIPAEAMGVDLSAVSTRDLRAELQRRSELDREGPGR